MKTEATDRTSGVYRYIHASALTGKRINAVSIYAEAVFWRLHMIADDFGNLIALEGVVGVMVFPKRPSEIAGIEGAITELEQAGLINCYADDGDRHIHLADFIAYQPNGKNGKRVHRVNPPQNPQNPETFQEIPKSPAKNPEKTKNGVCESKIIQDFPNVSCAPMPMPMPNPIPRGTRMEKNEDHAPDPMPSAADAAMPEAEEIQTQQAEPVEPKPHPAVHTLGREVANAYPRKVEPRREAMAAARAIERIRRGEVEAPADLHHGFAWPPGNLRTIADWLVDRSKRYGAIMGDHADKGVFFFDGNTFALTPADWPASVKHEGKRAECQARVKSTNQTKARTLTPEQRATLMPEIACKFPHHADRDPQDKTLDPYFAFVLQENPFAC